MDTSGLTALAYRDPVVSGNSLRSRLEIAQANLGWDYTRIRDALLMTTRPRARLHVANASEVC
jgi:hypothetical protein